jgi:hypothetical protein
MRRTRPDQLTSGRYRLAVGIGLALLAGGCVAILNRGSEPPPAPAQGGEPPALAGGGSATAAPSGAARLSNDPTWTGRIRVTDRGVDLSDATPQVRDAAFATIAYRARDGLLTTGLAGPAALWDGPDTPTYEQCVSAIGAVPLSSSESHQIPVRPGKGICIRTFDGEAIVFVRTVKREGSEAILMDAVRWVNRAG